MIEPLQTILQHHHIEVDEKPRRAAGELEVCKYLSRMDWMQLLDGLQLDDEAAFDQEVDLECAANALTTILDTDRPLTFHTQVLRAQLDDHAFAVNRFQQSRPKPPVHGDGTAYDLLRQRVDTDGGFHVLRGRTKCTIPFHAIF